MRLKKIISIWALLALMFGQVALAQHAASHVDHDSSFELVSSHSDEHSHDHNDPKESEEHQCPECILTNTLLSAYYNVPTILFSASKAGVLTSTHRSNIIVVGLRNANSPRAPPVILI